MNNCVLSLTLGHNCTAALSKNGGIIASSSEERFTRKKNQTGFPAKAIQSCLKIANISIKDVDLVVLASHITPPLQQSGNEIEHDWGDKRFSWYSAASKIRRGLRRYKFLETALYNALAPKFGKYTEIGRKNLISRALGIDKNKILSAEHHLLHAYAGIFSSGLKGDLLVITVDGEGDGLSSTVGVFSGGRYRRISSSPYSESIGLFYSAVTEHLGMKILEHEYKVMGLAPYASPERARKLADKLKKLIRVEGLRIKTKVHSHRFKEVLKKKLEGERFDVIAGAAQMLVEELLVKLVKNGIKRTGMKRVILSGGVFMNVKANQSIAALPELEEGYFMPSCGDESLPIGGCYWGTREILKHENLKPLKNLYLGPDFSDEDALKAIKEAGKEFSYEKLDGGMAKRVAKILSRGKVVARCCGRMEFGARALGNRSILADPSMLGIIEKINKMIKMRDFWMPFAPVIMEEHAKEYLKDKAILKKTKPYFMMITFDSTKKAQTELAGGVHPYDKTLRPQLINSEMNPGYYAILKEFSRITGRYGIINTSFNIHGEPIVMTPADALHTLRNSGLDYVIIGNYLVRKKEKNKNRNSVQRG